MMIFTGSTYKKVSLYFIIAAASVFLLLVVLGMVEYREAERELQQELSFLFQHSIQEQVKLNMEGEFVSIRMSENLSSKKRAIRQVTVITEDTTITKEAEVSGDKSLELFKASQTYLLLSKRLQPRELQHILDSVLQEKGLKTTSVVLIRHGDNVQTSGDTTRLDAYYRVPPVKGGNYQEIDYEGFVHYAPFVVFQWMPKKTILVLLLLEIVLLGAIAYVVIEKRKIKPDKIVRKGQYYYLGKTIFDTRKCELIGEKNEVVAVTKKPSEMLFMFLQNDGHLVEKNAIKEALWPDNQYTANQNLMSTMSKLRSYLKEVDCAFNVVTKKGDDYYELKYRQ
jgi:hypothetical protein